jgi:endonuclease/exonuclease/phosphatase family metal-dependent hydrolase
MVLVACNPPPLNPPAQQLGVLRILSWNTFNLPTIAAQMGQINLDEGERGRLVGRLLKESSYDVIALNEVFDETVRDSLIAEVTSGVGRFAFVVKDVDGGGIEDSGLVLLSRLQPVRFSAPAPALYQHHTGLIPGQAIPASTPGVDIPFPGTQEYLDTRNCADMDLYWEGQGAGGAVKAWVNDPQAGCLIAFHRYRACTSDSPKFLDFGAECDAGKGVAFVRLKRDNGDELDVYWSHTQATLRPPEYPEPTPDWAGQRQRQMEELAAMVSQWSPPGRRQTLILGDLNVDGGGAPFSSQTEYQSLLGPGSLLGNLGFRDLWAEGAPLEDSGQTYSHRNDHVGPLVQHDGVDYPVPEERLDYLLWRDQDGPSICTQHPRVERQLDFVDSHLGTTRLRMDLSDHFGVGAELRPSLNGATDPCSPRTAARLGSLPQQGRMSGDLHVPGACQWLRIDSGTWTVTNQSAHELSVTAYAAKDISEPLAFYRGDGLLGGEGSEDELQLAEEGPFLLKLCWSDPTHTGPYHIQVSPNVGADPKHPVVLPLNREVRLRYGSQYGHNPSTLLWTSVILPRTFSGAGHSLTYEVGEHQPVPMRLGTAVPGPSAPPVTWLGSLAPQQPPVAGGLHGGGLDRELHVVVERATPADPAQEIELTLRVSTDHHEVHLGALECRTQEDDTGDDRIRLSYRADGRAIEIEDLGDFDEGQDKDLSLNSWFGRTWVRGDVTITIHDQDGEDLEDDLTSGSALDLLGVVTIPAFKGAPPLTSEQISGTGAFQLDGADYLLEYSRRR